jgi:predicted MFS family arabinose efflux permease
VNRWTILAILFVARTSLGFQFQTVGSVSELLAADLAINFTQVGTLIGLFMLPGLVLSLPTGYLGRFASDRSLASLGLACLAIGGVLVALTHGFALAAVGRLICGAGFVLGTVFFTKMITDWFAGKEIATAMGVLVMSWPLGIAIGQIGHGWLARSFHWPMAFYAASLFCLAGLLLVLLLYSPPPDSAAKASAAKSHLSRREFILLSFAAAVWAAFNAGYIVYLSFVPLLLQRGGAGPIEAAATASLASWAMIASIPLCGLVADRTGRPDLILYACLASAVVALLLLPYDALSPALCLTLGLIGMAPAGIIMTLPGQVLRPENRAFGMGIFFTWYFVITAPAPIIGGWLFDVSGKLAWSIYFAAALFAATAGAYAIVRLLQFQRPAAAAVI